MDISTFQLIRPWWLLALIPVALLSILLLKRNVKKSNLDTIIHPKFLELLAINKTGKTFKLFAFLVIFSWITAVFALTGPSFRMQKQIGLQQQNVLIIVLDLSLSMLASDIKPDRWTRAKFKVQDILSKREEGLTALVAYAGDAYIVAPVTDDTNTIATLVSDLHPKLMPLPGNRLDLAIEKSLELEASLTQAAGSILVITDEIHPHFYDSVKKMMGNSALKLNLLAVGTKNGGPILINNDYLNDQSGQIVITKTNIANFATLADQVGGKYVQIQASDDDILYLLSDDSFNEQYTESRRLINQSIDDGFWLILLLLPIAAMFFRKGLIAGCILFISLPSPTPSFALSWEEVWKTPDQQGEHYWSHDDYARAFEKFNEAEWKGLAAYRNQDFANAIRWLEKTQSIRGQYNLGNAFAKSGKIDDAIKVYKKVLEKDPDHEDARFNLDMLQELQQRSQQSKSNQSAENFNQPAQSSNNSGGEESKKSQAKDMTGTNQKSPTTSNKKNEENTQSESDRLNKESKEKSDLALKNKSNTQKPSETNQDHENGNDLDKLAKQQALEQWLNRIPDNPGYFLQKKFYKQSKERLEKGEIYQSEQSW